MKSKIRGLEAELRHDMHASMAASDKVEDLQDKIFHTKSLHDDTCNRLGHERKEAEAMYRELLQTQHGAPSNWIDRNAELL